MDSQLWTLSILLVLTTVVSYYYYLRVAWFMWMRPTPEGQVAGSFWAPLPLKVALVAGAGVILYLGIFPGGLLDGAMAGAEGLGLTRDIFLGLGP